jgi:hypothetical protein
MRDEKALRVALREAWGKKGPGLTWVEPGRGGTIGCPDVLVPVGNALVGLELKVGRIVNGRIVAKVRPNQLAWHLDMWRNGVVSGFLVGFLGANSDVLVASPDWFVRQLEGENEQEPLVVAEKMERLQLVKIISRIPQKRAFLFRRTQA